MVSIPACHAGDPGSIPGNGVTFFFCFCNYAPVCPFLSPCFVMILLKQGHLSTTLCNVVVSKFSLNPTIVVLVKHITSFYTKCVRKKKHFSPFASYEKLYKIRYVHRLLEAENNKITFQPNHAKAH